MIPLMSTLHVALPSRDTLADPNPAMILYTKNLGFMVVQHILGDAKFMSPKSVQNQRSTTAFNEKSEEPWVMGITQLSTLNLLELNPRL